MKSNNGKKFYTITTQIHDIMLQYEYFTNKSHKLGRVESNLLQFLSQDRKAYPMKDISNALGVSYSRVTHLVDSLVVKGFLIRFPSVEDRRVYLAQITDEGVAIIFSYKEKTIEQYNELLNSLSIGEQEEIFKALSEWKDFLADRKKEFDKKL